MVIFDMIKKEIRILGIDDSPFNKFKDKKVLIVGTVYRGGVFMDGLISTSAQVDGDDATEKIIEMIKKTKHRPQLQVIMLKGVAVGGFNVIDIREIFKKTKIPVIVVMKDKPDLEKIEKALSNVKEGKKKMEQIRKTGKIVKSRHLYVQSAGISGRKISEIIGMTCTHGKIPEPIRVAHLIASGIVLGESRGRA